MTQTGHGTPEERKPSRILDWSSSWEHPDEDGVLVLSVSKEAARDAANFLFFEGLRFPDAGAEVILDAPLLGVDHDLQANLLHIATRLLSMSPLSITTEVSTSGDTAFHLVTTQPTTGHWNIDLQVPTIVGEKGDKGDKGDTGDTGAPGADGLPGADGEQGEQGEPGDTGATGATGAKGDKGDKGDTGDTGATGATGAPGTPATTNVGTETPTDSVSSGNCISYNAVMAGNGQYVLPVIIQPGYTIQVSEMVGASSDNAFDILSGFPAVLPSPWYCPDGNKFVLGSCEVDSSIDAVTGDPAQDMPHMVLIMSINGELYPVYTGDVFTIPDGTNDLLAIFQLNDGVLYDNQGQIEFLIEICNPDTNSWCWTFHDAATHFGTRFEPTSWAGQETSQPSFDGTKWVKGQVTLGVNGAGHNVAYCNIAWILDSPKNMKYINALSHNGSVSIWINGDGSLFSGTNVGTNEWNDTAGAGHTVSRVDLYNFTVDGTGDQDIYTCAFAGDGTNPIGANNC